jgi:hypothetical protein
MDPGRRLKLTAAAALAALLALGATACGSEEETTTIDDQEAHVVVEGEPLELGDLHFNVAITRFLNPDDIEDAEYLEGLSDPAAEADYLAVFMTVENEGDEDLALPAAEEVKVEDTTGAVYDPVETDSIFALELGAPIPAGGEAPAEDTAAASGPVQGSFILFEIPKDAQENRPLELEIEADGELGIIELDL